jgi:hypothetical protein
MTKFPRRAFPITLLALTLLARSVPAFAQLIPPVQLQFFNAAGTSPLANGFLCTTQSGGSVSQLTYQDQALTVANANPIALNASGRPSSGGNEVAVFLQQLNYRFTVYASGTGNTCNGTTVGALIRQVDGVNGVLVSGSAQVANLGLGAAADATARLLVSQVSNTATILIVNSSVNKNWGIYNITNGAATDLRFNESNASADRLTLQAGGNVGIGTTAPTETLHVNGTGRFTRVGLGAAADASNLLQTSGGSFINSSGALVVGPAGPHAMGGATDANTTLYISGNAPTNGATMVGVYENQTFSPSANQSVYTTYSAPLLNKAAAGTHPLWAAMRTNFGTFGGTAGTPVTDIVGVDIATWASPANTTNATGLRVAAPTGATNNYAIHATSGSLVFDSAGPHAIGGATDANTTLYISGNAPTNGATMVGVYENQTFSPSANQSVYATYSAPLLNKAASGTHPLLAAIRANFGTFGGTAGTPVTDIVGIDIATWGSPANTTNATGIRAVAPTAATNNYAARFFKSDASTLILALNGAGDVQWGPALVTLGGGAAPTLGTIGGSGPTAAAQNSWMRVVDSTGAAFWVPVWK